MINSISNMGSSMQMMRSSGMQGPPPPKDKDVFQVADSDGDGLVSLVELEVLAEGMEEVTGNSINVDEALSSFDANQDGGLSGEELLQMMGSNGFAPPGMVDSEESGSAVKPPPPPPMDQTLASYGQNSGDDQIAQLIELLQSNDSDEEYASIDVTS